MNFVKKGQQGLNTFVQKPAQNEKQSDDNDISLQPTTNKEPSPPKKEEKKSQEDPEDGEDGAFKCLKWLCRIFGGISFTLKVQITLFVISALLIILGTALVGYFVNSKFHLAMVPEATLAIIGAIATYKLKDNVDTVGDVLETIKSFLEPSKPHEGPGGLVAGVVRLAFGQLKDAMISTVKMMIVGPPVGTILVGVVGEITGACFFKFVGDTDHTIRFISLIVIIVSGIMIIGSFPALCICIAVFKRLKKKIEAMIGKLEQKVLAKIA